MEEGSTMEDGFDDGGGLAVASEGDGHRKGEVLDQEMGGCIEICSSDREKEGFGGGVLEEVLDDGVKLGERLVGDAGASVEGGNAARTDLMQFLDGKGRSVVPAKKVVTPNWRNVVMGNVEKAQEKPGEIDMVEGNGLGMDAEMDGGVQEPLMEGICADAVKQSLPSVVGKDSAGIQWKVKNCREIVFDEKDEEFLAEDGFTVQVNLIAAEACEAKLGRALVGRVLGRPVPFGFLNRDLSRKLGHFGKMQLSLL